MTKPMIHNSKTQSIHTEIKSVGKTTSKKFGWNADFFFLSPISLLAGNSLRKQRLPNGRKYYSADGWLLQPLAHPILERILMERYQSRFFGNEIIRQPSAVAHCLISTWQLINEEPLIICHSFQIPFAPLPCAPTVRKPQTSPQKPEPPAVFFMHVCEIAEAWP